MPYLLFPNRPVYEYNGRKYQINRAGVVFDISAMRPDPHFPGLVEITDGICNITDEIEQAVLALKDKTSGDTDE